MGLIWDLIQLILLGMASSVFLLAMYIVIFQRDRW